MKHTQIATQHRIIHLTVMLTAGEILTTENIRLMFGVSAPTAKRDIRTLKDSGLPLVSIPGDHPGIQLEKQP